MKQVQRGFTLIELVMVIVILGVLAAVAMPKFVDLKGDAQTAAAKGVAGALASASAINYARSQISGGTPVATCQGAAALLEGGSLPTGFTMGAATVNPCSVSNTGGGDPAAWNLTTGL